MRTLPPQAFREECTLLPKVTVDDYLHHPVHLVERAYQVAVRDYCIHLLHRAGVNADGAEDKSKWDSSWWVPCAARQDLSACQVNTGVCWEIRHQTEPLSGGLLWVTWR